MTVKELMEVLSRMDPNAEVTLWNAEWDCNDPIEAVTVDQDGVVEIM